VIEGNAFGLIGAKVQSSSHETVNARDLGFLIDYAAGCATTEGHSSWALQHFHLIHIERVAVVAAEVAHAVEEDVVARSKTADGEAVSLGSAFTGGEADAGYVT